MPIVTPVWAHAQRPAKDMAAARRIVRIAFMRFPYLSPSDLV
jgi:hypothetical protein